MTKKKMSGFAVMDKEKRTFIAQLGGRTAHIQGKAHTFTSEEASKAGKRGGGRPHVLTDQTLKLAQELYIENRLSQRAICKLLNISWATLYHHVIKNSISRP